MYRSSDEFPARPLRPRICMHAPSGVGGHPLYVQELLTAMVSHPAGGDRFALVTGADLLPQFRTDAYPIHGILSALRHRSAFPSTLAWAFSRLRHYPRMDRFFLEWMKDHPELAGVHFQEFSPSMARLCRNLRRSGRAVFYTVHNIRPHAYPPGVPRRMWDALNRQACLACDRLFVHTARLREELAAFLGCPHPPIDVVTHGVWAAPPLVPVPPVAERMAWKRLLFFGTIRRNKGLELLFEAAESLRDFHITIAGEAREAAYFHREVRPRVARLRAGGVSVELIDRFVPQDEVGPLLARHSAMVLPYTAEFSAQSGVAFLALAHGMPIVASEAGGLHDLFEQFAVGTTFSTRSAAALAVAVRACFADAAAATLANELRVAKERFSWHAAAGATLASYAATFSAGAAAKAPPVEEQQDDRVLATVPAHPHG